MDINSFNIYLYSDVVQFPSHVWLFATPWTAAHQASLSLTISQSLLKLISIEFLIQSNCLIFCHPLLLLTSVFPSIRVFYNGWALCIRCQRTGASASALVLPMNIQGWFPLWLTGLISLNQGTLKNLLQHHNLKSSILRHSAFFMVQLKSLHDYWKNQSFDYMDLCQ